jgi:DNA-binding beta-propeller fold protein YncE
MVFGPDHNLYVSVANNNVANNNEVLRYNGVTGAFIDAFVPSGSGGLNAPIGLTFGPDHNLYVSSQFTNSILRYNGTTGSFIDAFVLAGSGGLNGPRELAFGPGGNLYVVSSDSDSILRYNGQTGAFIDAVVPPGEGGLLHPNWLTFQTTAVPEPASLTLLGVGTLSLLAYSWRRRQRAQ